MKNELKICALFCLSAILTLSHVAHGQVLAGTDDLGRILPQNNTVGDPKSNKTVALFYFLWQGNSTSPTSQTYWDLTKITATHPEVLNDPGNQYWGTTAQSSAYYFWGESIYNYYKGEDYWVQLKNMQLLTDAGVDLLVLDATNAIDYNIQAEVLMDAMDAIRAQGKNPPKIAFYTNSSSGATMQACYNDFYKSGAPYYHPNCWYNLDGKPLIIGLTAESAGKDYQNFFTYRESQWPFEAKKANGWPWIEFVRPPRVYYNASGQKEIVNVSVAQHPNCGYGMGNAAFYGCTNNWGRSLRNGSPGNPSTDTPYGYNFQEHWDFAIAQNTPFIFVTGWNEWIAGRWPSNDGNNQHSLFVDLASPEFSRDIEPTLTGNLKDNYYMQMVSNIRKYKGIDTTQILSGSTTITNFTDWATVTPAYKDYTGDIQARNHPAGAGNIIYTNTTGRNDFDTLKVARDANNIYFYAKTAATITANSGSNWMRLYIDKDRNATTGWKGYEYRVIGGNTLQQYTSGAWVGLPGSITNNVSGNQMYLTIPRSSLGNLANPLNFEFKWSDNMQDDTDPLDWYVNGDAAPGARFNFIASSNNSTMTNISSAQENKLADQIKIFPNPAHEKVEITFANVFSDLSIKFMDVNGNTVKEISANGVKNITVELRGFAKGTYSIQFHSGELTASKTIVLQ